MGCTKSKSVDVAENTVQNDQNKKNTQNDLIKSAEFLTSKNKLQTFSKFEKGNALMVSYKSLKSNGSFLRRTQSPSRNNINKSKKEPYTISKLDSDSFNIIIIKINACSFLTEYLIPIWFNSNTYIKFVTKGKWRIDKKYHFTDSTGKPSSNILKFNYGALVGRIGSGPAFVITPNEFTFYSEKEGPLYLKMNLPKNVNVNPEGTMEVKVFEGNLMNIEEIYERIGWKSKDMKYDNNISTDIENELTSDFNNLRMNPILFYEKIIKTSNNKIWTEQFLKQMKMNNDNNGILPFNINNNLYIYLHNYIGLNYEYILKNIAKRDTNKFLRDFEEKIHLNIQDEFCCENATNCRISKKYNSLDICMQYLFDIKFRKKIFNKDYTSIAVKVIEEFLEDSYLIILVIMKGDINDNDNGNGNENVNENSN